MNEAPPDAVAAATRHLTDTIRRQVDLLENPPPPEPDPVIERLDRIIALLEQQARSQARSVV